MKSRGFTLLEVLVAISILGLGLTIVLSSQAGLFASNQRAAKVTVASNLLRCKMSEVEIELLKNGFPAVDQQDSGECCEDESDAQFTCEWAVETIELPQPASFEETQTGAPAASAEGVEGALEGLATGSPGTPGAGMEGFGPLGALMGAGPAGQGLPEGSSIGDMASMMTSASSGGGIEAMAMSLVYPNLKPMLEASIRKVTVHVTWREGNKKQDVSATQYITNPTAFDPMAADNAAAAAEALGLTPPGSETPGATDTSKSPSPSRGTPPSGPGRSGGR